MCVGGGVGGMRRASPATRPWFNPTHPPNLPPLQAIGDVRFYFNENEERPQAHTELVQVALGRCVRACVACAWVVRAGGRACGRAGGQAVWVVLNNARPPPRSCCARCAWRRSELKDGAHEQKINQLRRRSVQIADVHRRLKVSAASVSECQRASAWGCLCSCPPHPRRLMPRPRAYTPPTPPTHARTHARMHPRHPHTYAHMHVHHPRTHARTHPPHMRTCRT